MATANPRAAQGVVSASSNTGRVIDAQTMNKIARLGMTERQQHLNRLWSVYCCSRYDARKLDWDGYEHLDTIEAEAISTQGYVSPGMYDAGASMPLKFRRPTAPYNLGRVIVNRFTGLLFSEKRSPQMRAEGDPDTEDYVRSLAEVSRLWPQMVQARTFGGATGTAVLSFQFQNGKPVVEVHDPRWVFPTFIDRGQLTLQSIEIRYMYPVEERGPKGEPLTAWYWYRRIIDENSDVVFVPEPVAEGDEPVWTEATRVDHRLSECPAVWVQNTPVADAIDGEPDCHGVYDTLDAIDALIAQGNRGILCNCDPTTVITTTAKLDDIRKGSDNAIKVPDGDAHYMEISGTGPVAAREMAKELRGYVLEVTQCVLDPDSGGQAAMTATEVERRYSSMLSRTDVFREQYGERGVRPLVEKMVRASRKLGVGVVGPDSIVKGAVSLPPRTVKLDDGTIERTPRALGPTSELTLRWPGYFQPTLQDCEMASRSAAGAKGAGLIDEEHAVGFVAPFFGVEDVPGMMATIREARQTQEWQLAQQMGLQGQAPGAELAPQPQSEVKFYAYELDSGIITINEVRASKGLGPLPGDDGDLTVPAYKAKYAATFTAAAAAESVAAAKQAVGGEE
jgi:hypothetical protein